MSIQAQQLLAVALLVGGFALAGPPVPGPKQESPVATRQVGQDAPATPMQPPKVTEQEKPRVMLPQRRPEMPKAKPPAKSMGKDRTAAGQQPKRTVKRDDHCDRLRRRLAATPNRVFSCTEMKAARACERPGDRGKATPAQIAKGWECWSSGQL